MTGFWVPHFLSVHCRVETKYTSALNGELNPYFHPLMVLKMGRFWVSGGRAWGLFCGPAAGFATELVSPVTSFGTERAGRPCTGRPARTVGFRQTGAQLTVGTRGRR